MSDYAKVYDMIDCEIDNIANDTKGLTSAGLEALYKLVDIKKDLLEIESKEMELDGVMEMPRENSYRQSRPMSYRGRGYSRNNGYSMDSGEAEDSYSHLEGALKAAKSEQERDAIRRLMSQLYK